MSDPKNPESLSSQAMEDVFKPLTDEELTYKDGGPSTENLGDPNQTFGEYDGVRENMRLENYNDRENSF